MMSDTWKHSHEDCVCCADAKARAERNGLHSLDVAANGKAPAFRRWILSGRYHMSWGEPVLIAAGMAWMASQKFGHTEDNR